mgnify:FL=1
MEEGGAIPVSMRNSKKVLTGNQILSKQREKRNKSNMNQRKFWIVSDLELILIPIFIPNKRLAFPNQKLTLMVRSKKSLFNISSSKTMDLVNYVPRDSEEF